ISVGWWITPPGDRRTSKRFRYAINIVNALIIMHYPWGYVRAWPLYPSPAREYTRGIGHSGSNGHESA
ncbi:MAG: hypothetical protein ACR2M4_06925, partial [Actinomycetota bacterium]